MGVHGKRVRQEFAMDDLKEILPTQRIARVVALRGKGIVAIQVAMHTPAGDADSLVVDNSSVSIVSEVKSEDKDFFIVQDSLAHLPPRFRNVLFLRRGAFLIVSPVDVQSVALNTTVDERSEAKVAWRIENLLRIEDVKILRKSGTFPDVFNPPKVVCQIAETSNSASGESCISDGDAENYFDLEN